MTPDQLKHFAGYLRRKRAELDLTGKAFAKHIGITRTTLRRYEENTNTQQPGGATVRKIAERLKVPEATLTGGAVIAPGDPRLARLGDEDLDVANFFHDAPTPIRQQILDLLQNRAGPVRRRSSDVKRVIDVTGLADDKEQIFRRLIDMVRHEDPVDGQQPSRGKR